MITLETIQRENESNQYTRSIQNKKDKIKDQKDAGMEFNNSYGMDAVKVIIEGVEEHLNYMMTLRNQHTKILFWEHLYPELSEHGKGAFNKGITKRVVDMVAVSLVSNLSKTQRMVDIAQLITTRLFNICKVPYDARLEINGNTMNLALELITGAANLTDVFDIVPLEGRENYLVLSSEWTERVIKAQEDVGTNVDCFAPMVVKPIPHKSLISNEGGYLESVSPLLKHPLKKGKSYLPHIRKFNSRNNPEYFKFINNVQGVAYCVNTKLLNVIDRYYNEGFSFEKFPGVVDEYAVKDTYKKVLNKKTSITTKIKAKRGEVFEGFSERVLAKINRNAENREREAVARTTLNLIQAEEFAKYEKIWYPVFADNRGRLYPYTANGLTYQGDEMAKNLLQFADKEVLTPEGIESLMSTLGNALGFDKRIEEVKNAKAWKWYTEHMMDFECGNFSIFFTEREMFEEPISALAIVLELVEVFRDPDNYKCGYICHRDARVSGSAFIGTNFRDKDIMEKTSVLDWSEEGKLGDSYTFVALAARDICQKLADEGNELAADLMEYEKDLFIRKTFKDNVMCYASYGLTDYGLRKNNWEHIDWEEELSTAHKGLFDEIALEALRRSLPTCFSYLNASRTAGKEAAIRDGYVAYTNPLNGFPVAYTDHKMKRNVIGVDLPGRSITLTLMEPTGKIDNNGISTATPPNLVHSCDAGLLFLACKDLDHPVSLIHDSIGSRPNDVNKTVKAYAKAMQWVANNDPLNNILSQISDTQYVTPANTATQDDVDSIIHSPHILS